MKGLEAQEEQRIGKGSGSKTKVDGEKRIVVGWREYALYVHSYVYVYYEW